MNKEDNPLFSYAYLDSQRLKETFFTPTKKKNKKDFLKKNLLIGTITVCLIFVIIAIAFFLFRYQIIAVSRYGIELEKNSFSLIHNKIIDSLSFAGRDQRLMKKKPSLIHFAMPPQEKIGLIIDFKKPLNLQSQKLLVYLKKSEMPLSVGLVLRDNRFFSNSLNPVIVTVHDQTKNSYSKTPIELTSNFQNVNLSQVTQLQLYFYPDDKNFGLKKDFPTERWVILKELLMINAPQN